MQPNPNTEFILLGTLAVLAFASAFDTTAPYAIGLLLFMLATVWFTAWQSGALGSFASFVQQRYNPQQSGPSGAFWNF